MNHEQRIESVQVIFGRPRHKLFFGWGAGLSMGTSDRYIDWLREKWLNTPKRVDLTKSDTKPLNVEKHRKQITVAAIRPRHPSRRSATAGQKF
jgi:hypothetical protein